MEFIYELVSQGPFRPVLVSPIGEHLRGKWIKANQAYAPTFAEVHAATLRDVAMAAQYGHAAPQYTGFAHDAFATFGLNPRELPDEVPGVRIAVDSIKMRVRVFDPLIDAPNRVQVRASFVAFYRKHITFQNSHTLERLSEADLRVWQAWLDAAVANGTAERVKPEHPADWSMEPYECPPENAAFIEKLLITDQQTEPVKEPVVEPVPAPKPTKTANRRRTPA